jgi:hypothetical protein
MNPSIVRILCGLTGAILLTACSAASPAEDEPAPTTSAGLDALPPPGYGTLRQDDFTVPMASGPLQIKVTPLDESVIRLAAPDTYQRLHGLAQSRSDRIRDMGQQAGLREDATVFLVSFFTREQQAAYEPTGLQMLSNGILYRALGILPLTPEWGRQQVKQEESQSALYLFDPAIDLDVTFEVEYLSRRSLAWTGIIRTLQAERGRVVGRAKG